MWWTLANPLADRIERMLWAKLLQPPRDTGITIGGHVRRVRCVVAPAGSSTGQHLERGGLGALGLDESQDLPIILWREGTPALLRIDAFELRRAPKRLLVRPDARDPDGDARRLHGSRQKV